MNRRYDCGGIGSYEGPCGAEDCATCHPEWQGEDTDYHAPRAEDEDDARREDAMIEARERGRRER